MTFGVKQFNRDSPQYGSGGGWVWRGSTWIFQLQQCLSRAKQMNQFSLDPT